MRSSNLSWPPLGSLAPLAFGGPVLTNYSRVFLMARSEGYLGSKIGKFHSADNSLLSFCSSPFRVEVQCQPQRGGTDRHEIHETAGYRHGSPRHHRGASISG